MTVAALSSTVSYTEDGSTTVFPVPYRFRAASDLVVERIAAAGTIITLTLNIDYTVTGGDTDAGGSVTLFAAGSGTRLRVRRETPRAQPMVYNPGDRFPAKSHEGALDRQMLIAQEQDDVSANLGERAALVPDGEIAPQFESMALAAGDILYVDGDRIRRFPAAGLAGKFLGGNATGRPVALNGTGADDGLRGDLADEDAGAQLVAVKAPAAWAVKRTAADKAAEDISLLDGGILADGSDQTSAIVTLLGTLMVGGWTGRVVAPPGLVFDAATVAAAVPEGVQLVDRRGVRTITPRPEMRSRFLVEADMGNQKAPQRIAFIEQQITGFFGRGMLTAETNNLVTEQSITVAAGAGAASVTVENGAQFVSGGCAVIEHPGGVYLPYQVSVSGNVLTLRPKLALPVVAGSRIERLWFNSAHPGKFYMRHLAQRIAWISETEAALPDQDRFLFCNFDDDDASEDKLRGVGGGTVYYFDGDPLGSNGTVGTPVRFLGRSAYVDIVGNGDGAQTAFFDVSQSVRGVARVGLYVNQPEHVLRIRVLAENGNVLASYTVPNGAGQTALRLYTVPFHTRHAAAVSVEVTVQTVVGTCNFTLALLDCFFAPEATGPVVSRKDPVIVCLGDSWFGGDPGSPERESICVQLAKELPLATIINAGVGGNKVWEELARFDTDVAPYRPDYVVVNTGTNEAYSPASVIFDPNALEAFRDYYNLLINKILSIGARPVLIGPPALCQHDPDIISPPADWTYWSRSVSYQRFFLRNICRVPRLGAAPYGRLVTLTGADGTTPNVAGLTDVNLNYGSATTITNFLGARTGQTLRLTALNGNVTLKGGSGAFFKTPGDADIVMTANSVVVMHRLDVGVTDAWTIDSANLK